MTALRCFNCGAPIPQPDWVCESCGRYNQQPILSGGPGLVAAPMAMRDEFPGVEGPEFDLFPGESAEIGRRAP